MIFIAYCYFRYYFHYPDVRIFLFFFFWYIYFFLLKNNHQDKVRKNIVLSYYIFNLFVSYERMKNIFSSITFFLLNLNTNILKKLIFYFIDFYKIKEIISYTHLHIDNNENNPN